MAGPNDTPMSKDAALQSSKERFSDIYNKPAANANDGYFKVPDRSPPPAPTFEPPKPQKISESMYSRQQRYDAGFTSGRVLKDNPGFRSPLGMPENVPPGMVAEPPIGAPRAPMGGGVAGGVAGIAIQLALPYIVDQGGKDLQQLNDPNYRLGKLNRAIDQHRAVNKILDDALNKIGIPPWLNPFKNTTQSDDKRPPSPNLPPPLDPAGDYVYQLVISGIDDGTNPPRTRAVEATSISTPVSTSEREPRGYWIDLIISNAGSQSLVEATIRPTISVSARKVRRSGGTSTPENRIPETGKPFFPPAPDLDDLARQYPPTILDPNDFKKKTDAPGVPSFPPTSAPIPKPLDPIQKPDEPLKPGKQPKKDDQTSVPPLPFNPLSSPPNPQKVPPSFEPGPQNPNQRLNDRGIFPSRKADVTATVSGSPLSPDIQIGGDPVTLKPAPKIPKPKTPEEEQKEKLIKLTKDNPILPLIPPIFPKPTTPDGSLDPTTADDITKSKEPPKPPVGTKPKCQDGCMAGLQAGQESILSKLSGGGLNGVLNGAEVGLLGVINNKLGDQVPGGLSGFLGKFREAFDKLADWMHLDRLLNILTFTVTLQNAYFLCDSLKIVTMTMIGDALSVIGIKDKDNNPLNINKIIDDDIEGVLKKILGEEQLTGFKKEWKALNRIYQAGSNIINATQSIGWSILNALNIIGSSNAQIGNALKKYKVIGERAFTWMNPAPNFHNKFFTATFNALNIVSNIDFVAQSILSARQSVDQIEQQSTEFQKDFTDLTNPKPAEHKPTATAETKAKTDSHGAAATEADLKNFN